MKTDIKCHAFSVHSGTSIQQQFNYAAERFVAKWRCKPPLLWHHEATPLPENTGDLETAVDNQIPRGAWYFEIEIEGGDARRK